jgi:hypothetical protein
MAKAQAAPSDVSQRVTKSILDIVGSIPETTEPPNPSPHDRARSIASSAALRASVASGTLALPVGPAGLLLVLPELITVWRIQAQMVADIAGAFGKTGALSKQQMIYCLFKATAAQAVRDLVVRAGQRYVVQHTSFTVLQAVVAKVGIKLSKKALAKSVSRALPVIGALGVAGYAYYDTAQVAKTAIELFEKDIEGP